MVEKDFFNAIDYTMSEERANDFILALADGYKKRKIEHRLYDEGDLIPENIIALYMYFIMRKDYGVMVQNYKETFIINEALVEPGVTKEERIGLGRIYDYISTYDYENKDINIFMTALQLHIMLYSACPFPEYGGKLRVDTAVLKDTDIEVLAPDKARSEFQGYISKKLEVEGEDIFKYIDECIRMMVDLIRLQPFNDGNKRTFRALLNMHLGKIGIPPIYISLGEREVYKKELLKALSVGDYRGITRFYYYKICDAITYFGVNGLERKKSLDDEKGFYLKPKED